MEVCLNCNVCQKNDTIKNLKRIQTEEYINNEIEISRFSNEQELFMHYDN